MKTANDKLLLVSACRLKYFRVFHFCVPVACRRYFLQNVLHLNDIHTLYNPSTQLFTFFSKSHQSIFAWLLIPPRSHTSLALIAIFEIILQNPMTLNCQSYIGMCWSTLSLRRKIKLQEGIYRFNSIIYKLCRQDVMCSLPNSAYLDFNDPLIRISTTFHINALP